jgi:hypothetical protein
MAVNLLLISYQATIVSVTGLTGGGTTSFPVDVSLANPDFR